jgi:hypothetical protein
MSNDYNMLLKPSLYAHVLNGIFLLFAFILLVQYGNHKTNDYYKPLILYLLFSIAIGIHGVSHFCLEFLYNYNPLRY